MAQLWVRHEDDWAIAGLDGPENETLLLGSWSDARQQEDVPREGSPPVGSDGRPRILRIDGPAGPAWLLLTGPDHRVTVNGLPLHAGLRVLSDRDEIRWTGSPASYFSAETLAAVEPLPATERELMCPRCRQPIEVGSPAVRCPSRACGVWHHASERYPCWTYAASCALCPQPTDMEAGFQWTPEAL